MSEPADRRAAPRTTTLPDVAIASEPGDSHLAQMLLREYGAEQSQRWGRATGAVGATSDTRQLIVPPPRLLLVARSAHEPLGCVGLEHVDEVVGEIKRMYLRPRARGLGLGRDLLVAVEAAAGAQGYRRVRLDAMATSVEALSLYRASGYREVAAFNTNPYVSHWLAKDLRS